MIAIISIYTSLHLKIINLILNEKQVNKKFGDLLLTLTKSIIKRNEMN